MKISLNWLKDYIKTNLSDAEIANKLTLTGLEVEEVTALGSSFDGIYVGEVTEVAKHPNADKLTICQVNLGSEVVQIVCGAPNVAAGQKVAVATVGCTLPVSLPDGKPFKIKKSKIRGELSFGMICAEDELGIGTDHSGIMVLDSSLQPGTLFSKAYGAYEDSVLEIGLTPNRPDASCHSGVARDLHAVTGEPFSLPGLSDSVSKVAVEKESANPHVTIRIDDENLCSRYVGIVLKNISVKESPEFVQNKLRAIGLRPRNAVVDATNYVMHELGQPLHAFDLNKITSGTIVVKSFPQEMNFTTLDSIERKVPAGSLFICNGDEPIAIAGIMGGENSEIDDNTSSILIESAWFDPVHTRKTSKQLSLQTDSSYRFERGVNPEGTLYAALRCAALVLEWCGGEIIEPVLDIHPRPYQSKEIELRPARAAKIIGTDIPAEDQLKILKRLGFNPVVNAAGTIICTIPGYRPDVSEEIDLIEEIARIFDYNNIPTSGRISFSRPDKLPKEERFLNEVRLSCTKLGLQEFYSNSLLPQSYVTLLDSEELVPALNPISRDQSVLRPNLHHGFLKAAAYNFNRKQTGIRAFEIGKIFQKGEGNWVKGFNENRSLLLGLAGNAAEAYWNQPEKSYTIQDLIGITQAFFESLDLQDSITKEVTAESIIFRSGNTKIAEALTVSNKMKSYFELDKDAFIAEIDLDELLKLYASKAHFTYKPVSRFPAVEFDIALLVSKEISAGDMETQIKKSAGNKLSHIHVFDVFEGKSIGNNKKSIAFRMRFQDETKTLGQEDIEPLVSRITKDLEKVFEAELRG
ncbi:MAG: phenylalanine--tRNA ligase subunit beta [Balneolales bacterium]|nr:phenylalanine--tRNA ligase subunit beta [Balneolales bacterium]